MTNDCQSRPFRSLAAADGWMATKMATHHETGDGVALELRFAALVPAAVGHAQDRKGTNLATTSEQIVFHFSFVFVFFVSAKVFLFGTISPIKLRL